MLSLDTAMDAMFDVVQSNLPSTVQSVLPRYPFHESDVTTKTIMFTSHILTYIYESLRGKMVLCNCTLCTDPQTQAQTHACAQTRLLQCYNKHVSCIELSHEDPRCTGAQMYRFTPTFQKLFKESSQKILQYLDMLDKKHTSNLAENTEIAFLCHPCFTTHKVTCQLICSYRMVK